MFKDIRKDFYLGLGYSNLNLATTNWRGMIFRFGIIGLLIILFLFLTIVRRVDTLYAIILFSIAVLILAHRSYLLYTPGLYLLLYLASSNYIKKKPNYKLSKYV